MSQTHQQVILTIDDQPVFRRSLRIYLEDKGYVVLEAENGEVGLRLYATETIDLILLDLRMPEVSGLEVLSEIRKTNDELPVIVISGAGEIKDVVEALRLGAIDFIQKPIDDMSILGYSIEKALERAKLICENRSCQVRLEAEVASKTEELRTLNSRLKGVVESAKKFLDCKEIHESGAMILEEFGRQLNANGGSFYEVSENRLKLIHSLDTGHAANSLALPLQPGTVFARALYSNESFVIDNIYGEGWPVSGWPGYSSDSCVVFPFVDHDNHIFAILSLHNPKSVAFAPHDREIGAILASYASEALQTARAVAGLKHNEDMMLQSQKLEAVGTLAGGVAHDFNNILSAIVGYTDLSLFSEELSPSIKNNLEQIKKASQRARDLVRQILSFSRIEEAKVSSIDICPIIKEALKLLRASIPSSITIEQVVPGQLGLIKADPGRIHQVLVNLCTNASHAMQAHGGVLRVEYTKVEPDPNDPRLFQLGGRTCLKLSVADTGSGIKPEMMARIFEPYYTTKEKSEGTGLGLAMVHGIVRASGGVVTVDSQVGKGTIFDVYFPCVEDAPESPRQKTDYEMPQGNERIMFVDDEETLAEMAGEMLKRLGYTVQIMTSSVDAADTLLANAGDYDLIITDQTMPTISGLELARKVMEVRSDIPIILYTGYSAAISEDEAKQIGICKVLMKPLSMTLLSQVVRQVLDGAGSRSRPQ